MPTYAKASTQRQTWNFRVSFRQTKAKGHLFRGALALPHETIFVQSRFKSSHNIHMAAGPVSADRITHIETHLNQHWALIF